MANTYNELYIADYRVGGIWATEQDTNSDKEWSDAVECATDMSNKYGKDNFRTFQEVITNVTVDVPQV